MNSDCLLPSRLFPARLAAWLALVAIAMLFIAPVISKSLMQAAACPHDRPPTTLNMAHMSHDEAPTAHCDVSGVHNMLIPAVAQSPMEEIACGYCQLLIHLPFVALLIAVTIRQLGLSTRPTYNHDYPCPLLFRPWSPLCARGPPVCCFSF